MAIRPSIPEIITVNSEELQTQIRDLLPSQNGFGSELQASNVITPIIDLTAAAEGSQLRSDLQTALAFGSQTAFNISNTTTTIANSPGFYRIFGVSNVGQAGGQDGTLFNLTDGFATKAIWQHVDNTTGTNEFFSLQFDFVVWLGTGESINGQSTDALASLAGSVRQIASSDGTLVSPNGFPL
jgi:hypothetical protein